MGSNQYWAMRVNDMCVYYLTGAPEGSPKVVLKLFVAFPCVVNQYWARRVYDMCVFYYMMGAPEGSPKVVLWRSRESNLQPLVYKT